MSDERERKPEEIAGQGVGPVRPDEPVGLVCAGCGCRHFYTIETRPAARMIVRRRECRHCGKRITTRERIVENRP